MNFDISNYISSVPHVDAPGAARALVDAARKMGGELSAERSVKLDAGGAAWNRFLLGIDAAHTTVEAVREFARAIGMPLPLVNALVQHYEEPSSVLVGFEQHDASILYKVYLEFWNHLARQVEGTGDRLAPILLNIGFKWDIRDRRMHATTHYRCHPLRTPQWIVQRIRTLTANAPREVTAALAAIVDKCSRRVARPSFVYMEAEETGARRSFDLNLYQADLPLAEIIDPMVQLQAHLCPGEIAFEETISNARYAILGHLSAGTDRSGNPFVTLYFED